MDARFSDPIPLELIVSGARKSRSLLKALEPTQ
jgi:hypothetical protein